MRKVFLTFFILGIVISANAQFGIRAGFSISNFSKSDFTSVGFFHIGGYYQARTYNEMLSIEPGIQYSGKGYETIETSGGDVTENLGYIDVPVLVRLSILPSLNFFAGPQASLLVFRNYSIDNRTISTSLEPIRGYDLAAVAGVGVNIASGLNFQASYDFGLTSLNYFNADVSNRVLKFSLAYSFGN